ncbi:MAG: serine protease [Chloroflexi bacterium]|nr:serine protease [Chloroflexota bacterium]
MAIEITEFGAAELSDGLAAAVERAGQSTVTVHARRRIPASGIAWTADGVILTCDHVVERDEDITIGLPDGRTVAATIAGRDAGSDLAVLRADVTGLTPADRAAAGEVKVGHLALALGRPSEEGVSASLGVVSAVRGPWRTFGGAVIDGYYRTDATFFPGFSGGPLVLADGRVAGINSSRLGRGAGLTIPAAAAAKVAEALLAGGRLKRGYLGIGSQPVKLPAAIAAELGGQETGLLIVTVEPGSPAEAGGVMLGDILVAIGAHTVTGTESLHLALGADSVGQPTAVTVMRGGAKRELTVTVGERA